MADTTLTSPPASAARPRRRVAGARAAGLAAVLLACAPGAALAQYFSPYYAAPEPGPYYGPRIYRSMPPPEFPQADVRPMLRSMGFGKIGSVARIGNQYVVEVTDADGLRLRVRLSRFNGEILSMSPLARSAARTPVPPAQVPSGPMRTVPAEPPAPRRAALPPPAAVKPAQTEEAAPQTATKPAEAKPPVAEAKPLAAEAKPVPVPAGDPRTAAVPPASPIRVIPPAPAPAPLGLGASSGTATNAGSATPGAGSAGSAAMLSRAAPKKPVANGESGKPSN
ncbi:MAG TPA: hypothetical protein VLA00_07580 [Xanthobacteraceae bacterium]|nr:hypothetical protein [Xanthobacteraceae bacterium]